MDPLDTKKDLDVLYQKLEYNFQNPALLREALTHTSLHTMKKTYERLEFLGDRVLGLVVAEELFERFSQETEGNLAKRHAQLVRTETLAEIGKGLGLGAYIRMARGEETTGGRHKISILSDVVEAVIAAIYKDAGLEPARSFIQKFWAPYFDVPLSPDKDSKTSLQEIAQGRGFPSPDYRVLKTNGPPHDPTFVIEVVVEGLGRAEASGSSKRKAEKRAAEILRKQILNEAS